MALYSLGHQHDWHMGGACCGCFCARTSMARGCMGSAYQGQAVAQCRAAAGRQQQQALCQHHSKHKHNGCQLALAGVEHTACNAAACGLQLAGPLLSMHFGWLHSHGECWHVWRHWPAGVPACKLAVGHWRCFSMTLQIQSCLENVSAGYVRLQGVIVQAAYARAGGCVVQYSTCCGTKAGVVGSTV